MHLLRTALDPLFNVLPFHADRPLLLPYHQDHCAVLARVWAVGAVSGKEMVRPRDQAPVGVLSAA